MRVFLALPVPDAVRRSLQETTERLKQLYRNLKIPRAEGLHCTLFFLGERERAEVDVLTALLRSREPVPGPVPVCFGGCGTFPPSGAPRVIYVDVGEGREKIIDLQAAIGRMLERNNIRVPDDKRPFQPHLTIGRNKGGPLDRRRLEEIAPPQDRFILDRIVLYQSLLQRDGAVYRPLAERRL